MTTPTFDAVTALTASGQSHTGGAGANVGFLVNLGPGTGPSSPTWGGLSPESSNIPYDQVSVWRFRGDLAGAKTISFSGGPDYRLLAITVKNGGKLGTWSNNTTSGANNHTNNVPTLDAAELVLAFMYAQGSPFSGLGATTGTQIYEADDGGDHGVVASWRNSVGAGTLAMSFAETFNATWWSVGIAVHIPSAGGKGQYVGFQRLLRDIKRGLVSGPELLRRHRAILDGLPLAA